MVKKLKLTDTRNYFKPHSFPWAFDYFLASEKMHWIVSELQFHEDVRDWKTKLSEGEKSFLTNIFRFFTQGDIDVAGAYVTNYLPTFPQPEIRMMLSSFAAREAIHIHAYSHLVETLGMPDSLYKEFVDYKEMKDKHEYVESFIDKDQAIAEQIAVFSAFTEGLQLFSSFVMLLNFVRHGKMKAMGQVISWSMSDENLHCDAMIHLFREYIKEDKDQRWTDSTKERIYSIAEKMVELEDAFIDLCFGVSDMENLTKDEVKQYIRFIADMRLIALGMKGIFKVKENPLPWVDGLLGKSHTNFFENKSTAYAKGALSGSFNDVWGKASSE